MDRRDWPNLLTMFFEQAEKNRDRPFLWARTQTNSRFHPLTWREVAERIGALARALRLHGVQPGDRIVLVSENRPEWLIADLAIMAAGAITVPAYTTNTVDDHRHIIDNSQAAGIIVSTRKLSARALAAAHRSSSVRFAITIGPLERQQSLDIEITAWDDAIAQGRQDSFDVAKAARGLSRNDTACIIYTSGTGGTPKGVMHHHGAILHNLYGAQKVLAQLGLDSEVFLSFLPLSHSYEHTAGQFFPIFLGAQIYYAQSAAQLATDMKDAHPTIIMAVPRLYETMHAKIMHNINADRTATKSRLFLKTLALGQKRFIDPSSLTFFERVQDWVLERLVRNKVRKGFGGRLKAFVSGGAPLNPDIGLFFTAIGIRILQGYGQTETGPVVSVNTPKDCKLNTVGPLLPNTEVKIAADGEILVKGELVMHGYWHDEKTSAKVLKDGWLHTGDVGHLDADGHLVITDRKRDIIVNSGGDNIAPQRIEGLLTLEPEIAQAMVYGDKRPHLVALIVPDLDWLKEWVATHGKPEDLCALAHDAQLRAAIAATIERVNTALSKVERIHRFLIAPCPFTIDNGQMTPTLKIRRYAVKDMYAQELDALYKKR
ncbi:AMP-dependent synthetase/ligase [Varunaivibrio sulfuroxidans]|uniref:Long-chain acyl-CoA synthetase n=1 Tax=Varunaivibrio sulfuroxidans TaxID=1773489 RepID=A0A4R3JBG9_9PROT|nr:long-chain fatty acid--CoA ligase [Varunaivibrio sulfuroxidans]TCS63052.1 long-chain acyl-CoA synthetase [Varunaivibrio sulfuroxidans]WES31876.1 long-chain fatty acid--CoA ligase [Varunaivibrio sulfuroxidans]